MSGSHKIWQLLQWGLPLMFTRHSKQMPIPHRGPRGSPLTDVRHLLPANAMATATVAPAGTERAWPFTLMMISLGMRIFTGNARRQIRFDGDLRLGTCDLIGDEFGCAQ